MASGQPKQEPIAVARRAIGRAGTTLLLGLSASIASYFFANNFMVQLWGERSNTELHLIASKIDEKFRTAEATLEGLTAFLSTTDRITDSAYMDFSRRLASGGDATGLTALAYAPRVPLSQRARFDAEATDYLGKPIVITPPGDRATYAPLSHVYLTSGERSQAIGFDLLSESTRAITIASASATGEVAVSNSYRFVGSGNFGFILARTIEDDSQAEIAIPRDIRGYAIAGFSASEFVASLELEDGLLGQFKLIDMGEAANVLFTSRNYEASKTADTVEISTHVAFGGKAWQIVLNPAPLSSYLSPPERLLPIMTLIGGILLSIFFAGVVSLMLNRRYDAERIAEQMTERYKVASMRARHAQRETQESHEMMEASLRQLKALNSSLNRYAAITAHDLKAPLKRISTMIGFLEDDHAEALDEDGREILHRVKRSTTKLSGMVSSLLTYSRSSYDEADASNFSIDALIKTTLDGMADNGLWDVITLKKETDDDLYGNKDLLAHVFQNLISNSVKFKSDRKLAIEIVYRRDKREGYEITFTDNGIGIEPEHADKVFDMFTRLHNDSEYEGHGIGLATCQRIIFDHGGSIFVDKNHTDGTTFVIRFPIANKRKKERGLVA